MFFYQDSHKESLEGSARPSDTSIAISLFSDHNLVMATNRPGIAEENEVLALGEQAAQAIVDRASDALELVEQYVSAFERWESTWKAKEGSAGIVGDEAREVGHRIASQHAQILRLTEEMWTEVDSSLKNLHVKGKGLKTYIDQLPQRISTIKTKKG